MPKARKYPNPKEQLARAVKALRQGGYSEDRVLQLVQEAYRGAAAGKAVGLAWGLERAQSALAPGHGADTRMKQSCHIA